MGHHKTKVRDRILAFFMAVLLIINIVPMASYSQVKASSENGEEKTDNTTENTSKDASLPEGYYIQVVDEEDKSKPINIEGITFWYNIVAIPSAADSDNNTQDNETEKNTDASEEKTYSYKGENTEDGYIILKELQNWMADAANKEAKIEYKISLTGEDVPDYEVSESTIQFKETADTGKNLGNVSLTRKKPTSYVKFTVKDNGQPVKRVKISYEIAGTTSRDAHSVITYDDGTAYIGIVSENAGQTITYNVSKDGYKTKTGTYIIFNSISEGEQSSSEGDGSTINDFSKPRITVKCTGGSAKYNANGTDTTITEDNKSFEVDAGSRLDFTFTPEMAENQKGIKYVKKAVIKQTGENDTTEENRDLTDNKYTKTFETIQKDIEISVDFGTKYVVTVPGNVEGGSIVVSKSEINDTNTGSNEIWFDSEEANKKAYIKMSANSSVSQENSSQSYQINTVGFNTGSATEYTNVVEKGNTINDVTGVSSSVLNAEKTEYTMQLDIGTIQDNVSFSASFIKVYQVEIRVEDSDENSGTVKIDNEAGTSKIIRSDAGFKIEANPNTGYKVSKVEENGNEVKELSSYIKDEIFSKEVGKIDQNYVYTITFEKKVYSIAVTSSDGNVVITKKGNDASITSCQYDDTLSVKVTPDQGKLVESYTVTKTGTSEKITSTNFERVSEGNICFDVENVQSNITINIQYEDIPTISSDKALTDYVDITALKADDSSIDNGVQIVKGTDEYFIYCNKETEKLKLTPKSADGTTYNKIRLTTSSNEWGDEIVFSSVAILEKPQLQVVAFDTIGTEISLGKIHIIFDKTAPTTVQNETKILIPDRSKDGTVEDFYNKAVTFTVKASDDCAIKKISYKVTKQEDSGETSTPVVLYNYDGKDVKDVKKEFESKDDGEKIIVNTNGDNIVITVTVEDFSGNITTESKTIHINTDVPTIKIISDDQEGDKKQNAQEGYYQQKHLKISIKDKTLSYDLDSVKLIVKNENTITKEILLKDKNINWGTVDSDGYRTAVVTLDEDGKYQNIHIEYKNKNGSVGTVEENLSDTYARNFVIDKGNPTGNFKFGESTWSNILEALTFGIWKSDMEIEIKGSDSLSNVKIFYFVDETISDKNKPISSSELDERDKKDACFKEEYNSPISKSDESQFVVYAKIMDSAGNYTYICSGGIIIDSTSIAKDNIIFTLSGNKASEKHIKENGKESEIYTGDVTVDLEITDTEKSSGIQTISYRIVKDGTIKTDEKGNETVEGGTVTKSTTVLYDFSKVDPENPNSADKTEEQLKKTTYQDIENSRHYVKKNAIEVKANENNSCDVYVEVTVQDKAKNTRIKTLPLDIDYECNTNKPSVKLSYNNNAVSNEIYFKGPREAKITVTDRAGHFNEDSLKNGIKITADEASHIPTISTWQLKETKNNHTTYQATINFVENDHYTMSIDYTSKAGHKVSSKAGSNLVETSSAAPYEFSISNVKPTGTIKVSEKDTWSEIVSTLTFHLYKKDKFTVVIENVKTGTTTSIDKIEYYKFNSTKSLSETELNAIAFWKEYTNPIEITSDEQCIVYGKLTDKAGNISYISTDGLIVDTKPMPDKVNDSGIVEKEGIQFTVHGTKAGVQHNKSDIYTDNVTVDLDVTDENIDISSGIQTISYRIVKDGTIKTDENKNKNETVEGGTVTKSTTVLYDFSKVDPENPNSADKTEEQLKNTTYQDIENSRHYVKKNAIEVKADENNSCDVYVEVTVQDKAGNTRIKTLPLDIDYVCDNNKPSIQLSYDDAANANTVRNNQYFAKARTATVKITERAGHFDAAAATDGIQITATNAKGNNVSSPSLGEWSESTDKTTNVATIVFSEDANYKLSIEYKKKEGVENSIDTTGAAAPYEFTVDKTAPTAILTAIIDDKEAGKWENTLLKELNFNISSNQDIIVKGTSDDITSPVESVSFYKSTSSAAMTIDELKAATLWTNIDNKADYVAYTATSDEKFVIYIKVVDMAGNIGYYSTNGMIFDKTAPNVEHIAPQITVSPQQPINGIYKGDVDVEISVIDPKVNDVCSGIKTVSYQVLNMGVPTHTETVKIESGTPSWSGTIKVPKENNSNNVEIKVTAIDVAGNETTIQSESFKIDTTAPTVDISYDANTPANEKYYKGKRKATITVTERNFKAEDLKIDIIKTNANGESDSHIPTIRDWTEISNTDNNGNKDDTKHIATITYEDDGNYIFSIKSCTDMAGNDCQQITYDGKPLELSTSTQFTIDNTKPTGTIETVDYKKNKHTWSNLLTILTFGIYQNEEFEVVVDAVDETSPCEIYYYVAKDEEATKVFDEKALDELDKKGLFTKCEQKSNKGISKGTIIITNNQQYVVYAKLIDAAGNYSYIGTKGLIVDNEPISEDDIQLSLAETNKASGSHEKVGVGREDTAIYKGDVTVNVNVVDKGQSVGIKSIDYKIIKDDDIANPTQSGNLYNFANTNPSYEELNQSRSYTGSIPVKAKENNSCNVYAEVTVTDKLDRQVAKKIYMDIDMTNPTISLSYDNNTARNDKYFAQTRTATVVITERTGHFNAQDATQGIKITAENAKKEKVASPLINGWVTREAASLDSATHTATIAFNNDANYTLAVDYTDKADRKNQFVNTGNSKAPYEFTVDTTVPTTVLTATINDSEAGRWDKQFITDLTFGIRTNHTITVEGTSDDATSPVESVGVYKSNLSSAMTEEELRNITTWRTIDNKAAYTAYTANSNEQFTIYIKIVDMAGNTGYYSTNGMIFDQTAPDIERVAPIITISQPINDIYNTDVPVDIQVTDPIINDSYSGLKQISYKVLNMGSETYRQTLLEENIAEPNKSDIRQSWSDTIIVSKENNSNDVVVEAYALDYAGNETTVFSSPFKIDTTAPEISVSYDNNAPANEKYYKENRTAFITITERNFNANDVKIDITNTDGAIPSIGGWSQSGGSGNEDDTIHTATITYDADGDYTFAIEYTDMAGNVCQGETYGDSATPKEFTIDKTIPTILMEIDGNSKTGSEYYDAARTATITVNEHNFNEADFKLNLITKDNGIDINAPTLSGFSSNGDVHTATITFDKDEEVVISGDFTDMAGNNAETLQEARFVVDLTDPVIELDENSLIIDKTYGKNETVTPRINITDTNFDPSKVSLEVIGRKHGGIDINVQAGDVANGMTYILSGIETDDVYEMNVSVIDHSGRENKYTANFHVNRNGSTYTFGSALQTINKTYVQSLAEDLTIIETNVDPLEQYTLTLSQGGIIKELEFNKDFSVSASVNSDGWMEYVYTIKKEIFTGNSTYLVTVGSIDKAGNSSDSGSKNSNMTFVVDDEAPTLVVTGVENNKVYTQEKLDVTIEVYDNIEIMELRVLLNGELQVYTAEDLKENNGKIIISIPSSDKKQSLEITAVDYAGNQSEVANYDNITVSTNAFIAFRAKYLSSVWFYVVVGMVIIVIGAVVWFIIIKRKTKESE